MNAALPPQPLDQLASEIAETRPYPGHGELVKVLGRVFPDLSWDFVYSRSGWHRVGGVVDREGNRVAGNLMTWIEEEGADDLIDLFMRYEDDGLLATKLNGTTHYLTAKTGDQPWEFIQVEVNELREVADRELFDVDAPPDAVEDILSPDNPVIIDPTPLGAAQYELRKTWNVSDAYKSMASGSYGNSLFMLRFFDDWLASSATGKGFCKHFVLKIANYKDRFGEMRLQATPISTIKDGTPPLPGPTERGVDLAHFLTAYDRAAGYPMAWYFNMVCGQEYDLQGIARAVHEDISGAYDYLPDRDEAVLSAWVGDNYVF